VDFIEFDVSQVEYTHKDIDDLIYLLFVEANILHTSQGGEEILAIINIWNLIYTALVDEMVFLHRQQPIFLAQLLC
jgi:hypothetical protein